MIPMIENNPAGSAKIPPPSDLALLFERLMAYWRGAATRLTEFGGGVLSLPSPEFVVEWGGRPRGRLALRFDPSLYPWLMRQRDFKQLNLSTETEMLKEMTALYALYLIRYFSMEQMMEAGPLLPRRPLGAELNGRAPDSQVLLGVEGHQVWIRLWLHPDRAGA